MAGDPYYSQVSLLLHCDGTNGSTTFTDNSPNPKTATVSGNAQISTAQSKFGGASALFDGTGAEVSFATSADFAFGTAAFTLEFWYRSSLATAQNVLDIRPSGSNGAYPALFVNTNGEISYYVSSADRILSGAGAIAANTWVHVALSRAGTSTKLFIAGVQVGSTWSDSTAYAQSGVRIGASANGNLDDLRITKGVARYTTNFTPPAAAHPDRLPQFTGNITEASAISNWRVTATKCVDSTLVGTTVTAGSTYTFPVTTDNACNVTLSPKIDYAWTAAKVVTLDDYVVAVNPDTTPHLWKCTTAGTTGATEPTWNLSGTTTDNTVTWTYVAPLVDPKTLGPKIPS